MKKTLPILFCMLMLPLFGLQAQESADFSMDFPQREIKPGGALLRSLAVPGWGHYYVDKDNWRTGQYHLAADVVLIASWFGLNNRVSRLDADLNTLAAARAGTSLDGKSRRFEVALANFNSQAEYNDFQRRNRSINNLLEGEEFFWEWDTPEDRARFEDARERRESTDSQLGAIVGVMVVNRVISGLTSFSKARKLMKNTPDVSLSYLRPDGRQGLTANLRFNF
jgi:hypothetical protein